jgi:hypothetical protein
MEARSGWYYTVLIQAKNIKEKGRVKGGRRRRRREEERGENERKKKNNKEKDNEIGGESEGV